jgi:hypothetical protein
MRGGMLRIERCVGRRVGEGGIVARHRVPVPQERLKRARTGVLHHVGEEDQ